MIAIATGTRADWGLLLPLARQLRAMGHEPSIIATNAHLVPELGYTLREIEADGFQPAATIPLRQDAPDAVADATSGFARKLRELQPDCLVILGDRFEMLGAASAAMLCRVPVVHIAGGNISEGAYDDAIRHCITQIATLHLPETPLCAERIRCMRMLAEDDRSVVCAGSPGVYNALNTPLMSREEIAESLGFDPGERFLVGTLHSATLDTEAPLRRMEQFLDACGALLQEDATLRLILTYPNNDVDFEATVAALHRFAASHPDRVLVIPSLGRVRYLSAAALSLGVVGNSSSALEEIPSLGVPSLDIGIRQKGREHGESVTHCEADTASILEGLRTILTPEARAVAARRINPYFQPDTPRRQAQAILGIMNYKL